MILKIIIIQKKQIAKKNLLKIHLKENFHFMMVNIQVQAKKHLKFKQMKHSMGILMENKYMNLLIS